MKSLDYIFNIVCFFTFVYYSVFAEHTIENIQNQILVGIFLIMNYQKNNNGYGKDNQ